MASWRTAVSTLARHLVCRYEIPAFLASAWYTVGEGVEPDQKRRWFIAHGGGASFRSLTLPLSMTRKMEHIFLTSADHLPIEHALRRAELLALGMPNDFIKAILSTQLATDLSDGEFWRTVWFFLIANANLMSALEVGPLIDFLQAIRRDHVDFSMKGRTVQSMLRLMGDWHHRLGAGSAGREWNRSSLQPMVLEEPGRDDSDPPRQWQLIELTNSGQLRAEGAAMRHCVASYDDRCCRGSSRIWSLRMWQNDKVHHLITIEIDPNRRAIVQARAHSNRAPAGRPLRLLQEWAARERLQLAI